MPANRTLKAKFKSYTGRVFKLRNYAIIPAYDKPRASWSQKQNSLNRETDIASAVMVLDETNTRVCILKLSGTPCWIQKYFLLEEVTPPQITDNGKEAISNLCLIEKKLWDKETISTSDIEKLEQAISVFRTLIDSLN